jgi:putative FmdB family regulatory protein
MPIYEYRCDRGHTFEVMQRMLDDPLTACSTCGAPVQRVFHPVAVHFKGSGFYNTDYGKKKKGAGAGAGESGSSTDSSSSDKGDSKKKESSGSSSGAPSSSSPKSSDG